VNVGRLARAGGVGALLVAAVLIGQPAGAGVGPGDEPGIDIDHVEVADDGAVSVLVALDRLPAGSETGLGSLTVEVDGEPVVVEAEPVEAASLERTTILALDASDSMSGARIAAAKDAALAFLDAAPDDVRVGLLTFADGVRSVTVPTTDHQRLAAAIDRIRLTGGTRVYDAVVRAVRLAGSEGARNVLLLSDGRDRGSRTSLATAAATAADAGVVVDVVTLEQDPVRRALLSRIADASGGTVIDTADPAGLEAAFADQADALAHQVLVSFPRPDETADEIGLTVAVTADGHRYSDSTYVSLPAERRGPTAVATSAAAIGRAGMLVGAAALGLGLAVVVAVTMLPGRGPTAAQRQLTDYLGESEPTAADGLRESAVALANKAMTRDFDEKLVTRLAGAGMSLTPGEWMLIHAGAVVVAGFVGLVVGGGVLMVLGLLAGGVIPVVYLRMRHGRRLAAFSAQLPETLTLVAGGISAGLSISQAVDTVVREGHEPMAGELRRSLVEQRLGVDIEDALEGVADRMRSEDFAWVVMAVRIQREVGGNLSEILNTVADTLREREYLRRQVRTMSAEGRLSAYILGAIPALMFVYMLVANRTYVRVLYTDGTGLVLLSIAILLLGVGAWSMSRLVKVQV
jgi:tight adherence protein B